MGIFLTIILLSAIVALLGINRKFGFWGYFFASILLTPLLGLCLVVASDRRHPKEKKVLTKDGHTCTKATVGNGKDSLD
tara:strand:+ start:1129 stop:1365 length:237 start_codon:yes stop_codon:yes gene_type:complete